VAKFLACKCATGQVTSVGGVSGFAAAPPTCANLHYLKNRGPLSNSKVRARRKRRANRSWTKAMAPNVYMFDIETLRVVTGATSPVHLGDPVNFADRTPHLKKAASL
jgi:hypothetical protein